MTGTTVRRTGWPDSVSRPVVTPLQPSVVYSSDSPDALDAQYEGLTQGYTYGREGHPNADLLARKIDMLEGAEGGLMVGSGMAAVSAVMLGCLKAGDHVLGADQLYGRSLRMLREDLPRLGIATSLADPTDAAAMRAALRPETRMIMVEVVSNPTLRVADIPAILGLAREAGVLCVIDNTFTTPLGFRAWEAGADIVLHSVTKLLAGHSDVTLGYVATRDPDLRTAIRATAVTYGLTPSPYDCWMAERGLYTFGLRHARASATAAALADLLATHPAVDGVLYPGRADHPDHDRASVLLNGQDGTMVSFTLKGGRAAANRFVAAAPQLPFAPTLGDVATMLSHPASSSHRGLSPKAREALGIGEGMFRVSVGIEPENMVLDDVRRALDAVQD
ncbi:MAG: PLP-dependent transferase [Rhodobacteraceae bacterium]|nr:PLP-dependent transferase [Paracoccaceae bacterium]